MKFVFALAAVAGLLLTGETIAKPYSEEILDATALMDAGAAQREALPMSVSLVVGAGPAIGVGSSGARVDRLCSRLYSLGYLPSAAVGDGFTSEVQVALRQFQTDRGLDVDGRLGAGTVAELDRSAISEAQSLRYTSAKMTAFAASMPNEVIIVNIPSQTMTFVRGGEVVLRMRLAVGRPEHKTPLLDDVATHVVLNPTWTIPSSIIAKEELAHLRKGTMRIKGAKVYVDGVEVEPSSVDWSAVTPGHVKIVQSPGDANALGRYKVQLTNSDNIYLHDTNEHAKLSRDMRAISHGCIRMEEPREMVDLLLAGSSWNSSKIDETIASGKTTWVKLDHQVPIKVVYWTSTVDDGQLRFHSDVYGYEAAGHDPTH
jgi:murein L,D-transpeptidase YcbB/YkuD